MSKAICGTRRRPRRRCSRRSMPAHAAGRLVSITLSDSFCVGRYRDEFRALIRDKVDILFGNEAEITSLYEVDSFEKALEATRKEAKIAALTRSEKGSVVIKGSETHAVPAAPVSKIVDTTGAGDLYAVGFLFGFTRGKPLAECARLGGIAAAEIISHVGARPETALQGPDLSLGQAAQSTWSRWGKAAEVYRDRRQLIILLMGFASGMPLLLTLLGADLLDEQGRRRSHDDRHLCPGRHALRLQVRLGAAGRPDAVAGARPAARPPAKLDAAGAGRASSCRRSAWRSAIRVDRPGPRRWRRWPSPSSPRPRTSPSTPTASRSWATTEQGAGSATTQLGYGSRSGSSMPWRCCCPASCRGRSCSA